MIQFDEHIFQMGWNHEPENGWVRTVRPAFNFFEVDWLMNIEGIVFLSQKQTWQSSPCMFIPINWGQMQIFVGGEIRIMTWITYVD